MSHHLQKDLERLKKEIMDIASMAEQATNKAILALLERRVELAEEVIAEDERIDRKEVHIEEECLKVLALHQPVATDLRFIITVIKVNNDLERIADKAVNIAKRAIYLSKRDALQVALDFPQMADQVRAMLRLSLDALAAGDADLARKVLTMDDQVDDATREAFSRLQKLMRSDPDSIKRALHLLYVSRHLERIGDLASNIAQDIVYMVEGEIIRHGAGDMRDED
ncbi:phosphate signaling complex protein PhoU [Candidatus Sumerlaeota bacterium]|nr:phosphate signaling complex protein PhoU [Candidatus Sumerlaeota bacterium]